jgi:hypothetical protein
VANTTTSYNRGMRFRKLRIAFSALFGLLAALLIVLWVRSYYCRDVVCPYFNVDNWKSVFISSERGLVAFEYNPADFTIERRATVYYWHLVFVTTCLCALTATWVRSPKSYFSSRNLLIAAMLAVIAVGLISWAAK